MIKNLLLIFLSVLIGCAQMEKEPANKTDPAKMAVSYTVDDLHKIKWIEGTWKGTDKTKPFYEIYHFRNDTTLEIISFHWNGNDSTNSSKTAVRWKNGAYYLGEENNWKVTEITDSAIVMLPVHKATNDIVWKFGDSTSWDAILNSSNETTEYHMQAYDPFSQKPAKNQ